MQLGVDDRYVGEKYGVRQMKQVGSTICHAVFLDRVVKNRRIQEKHSGMERANTEKVRNHRVDCRGFVRALGDGGRVV